MPLGWIDFSKSERNKVLSVLDLLSEPGALDELGIAPVRDGFSYLFFPGTSTIQTRAKYFLIVPYALKDLEYSNEVNPNRIQKSLDDVERNCAKILVSGEDKEGIIGRRSLAHNSWVKGTPADIYWAGLRNYGIFTANPMSLTEYVRVMCAMKNQKTTVFKLGNHNDSAEEGDADDKDAGDLFKMQFWKIPTYQENWIDNLSIKLTKEEGAFLKSQIISAFPESMMAYILKNDIHEILECKYFQDMYSIIHIFPEQMQKDFALACDFSSFLFVLRTLYNVMVSDGKNEEANVWLSKLEPELKSRASVDLAAIISRLGITRHVFLCNFLYKSQELMEKSDLEGLKTEIKRRERDLKGSRSKTLHPGELDPDTWFGGGELDYRFNRAKIIIGDIYESEGKPC